MNLNIIFSLPLFVGYSITMNQTQLAELLEEELIEKYGHLLSGEALRKTLAYPSMGALQQAIARGLLPVPVFSIEKRKGKFALSKDVAKWLASKRFGLEKC